MIEELDHIGIAVHSLDDSMRQYTDVLGLELVGIEEVPTELVRVAVLRAGRTRIELLEPTSAESPIARFLDKRGPGVHHLAFRVGDVVRAVEILEAAGAPVLGGAPRAGAHGSSVAFIHPRHLGGVLAELVQPGAATGDPATGAERS
jgi:methylmalonyl-CoA/ethylmalonyl-CoA epimerase